MWRAHELLAENDSLGVMQQKKYIQGVGTELGEFVSGSIFGTGVSRKIREGFTWLVENYEEGNEIYIFGFSRGAFTARSLVQMIATCGLPRKETLGEWTVASIFSRYETITMQNAEEVRPIWRLRHMERHPEEKPVGWTPTSEDLLLLNNSKVQVVKVRMAGLWDTVGSMGSDALSNRGALTQKAAAHNVRPTKAQEYGYHALAIDEHRPMFDITLWRTFVEVGSEAETIRRYSQYYEQRWFIGAHSDVGGGYDDDDDSLPDLALSWMLTKAANLGLAFRSQVQPAPTAWKATIHDSFVAFAAGVLSIWDNVIPGDQRNYREIIRRSRDVATGTGKKGLLWSINETIDESVIQRWIEDPTYRPPRLVDYFRANPLLLPAGTLLAQRTKRIYAARYWNPTGVYLRAGRSYRMKVLSGIGEPLRDASYISRSIEGEDWNSYAHGAATLFHGKRKDDAKWFALIGTVDKKQAWTMVEGEIFAVPVGGQMLCYFNDVQMEAFYANNAGWVVLEVDEA